MSQQEVHSPSAVRDMSADWVIVTSCWPIRGQYRGYRPIRGRHEASEEVIMREVTGPGAMSGLLIIILGLSLGSVRGESCHKFRDESVNLMSRQPSAASLCNVLWSSESVLTQTRKPSVIRPDWWQASVTQYTGWHTGEGEMNNWCQNKQAPSLAWVRTQLISFQQNVNIGVMSDRPFVGFLGWMGVSPLHN